MREGTVRALERPASLLEETRGDYSVSTDTFAHGPRRHPRLPPARVLV